MRRRTVAAVLAIAVFGATLGGLSAVSGVGNVVAQPDSGEPRLDVFAPNPTITPGERTEFEVQIANDGRVDSGTSPDVRELLTTARNVRIEVDADDAPIDVKTGQQSIGSVSENEPRTVPVLLEVPRDAEPGEYELEVELRYRHAAQINQGQVTNDRSRTVTRTLDVEIDDGPRFELRNARTDAQVGGSGPMTVELENVGGEAASDLLVTLESTSARVGFDENPNESTRVGSLEPGETTTLEYDIDFGPGASLREYPLDATVRFEDPAGIADVDDRSTVGVTPRAEQSFAIDDVESTLRVAQDGTVRGTLVNEGPDPVDNVVVSLEPPSRNVEVIEPEVAVGSIDAGEAVDVSFDVEVASGARAGPRQFTLEAEYENDDDVRTADPIRFRGTVEPRQDVFDVQQREASITAGDTDRVTFEVTNNRAETVRDVSAKLFASSPLSAPDDEAFVDELEPGETVEITFRISASGDALAKDYPVSIDFQYVDGSGETRLTDSYRVPIAVSESTGGIFGSIGIPILAIPVGLAVLLPFVLHRRRG